MSDDWDLEGDQVIRVHVKPRRTLFTPDESDDLPIAIGRLSVTRRTAGVFADTGDPFEEVDDDWKPQEAAHRALRAEWTGKTYFTFTGTQPTANKGHSEGPWDGGHASHIVLEPPRIVGDLTTEEKVRFDELAAPVPGSRLVGRRETIWGKVHWRNPTPIAPSGSPSKFGDSTVPSSAP